MGRKRHTPEQIIGKLREAELELAKGQTADSAREAPGSRRRTDRPPMTAMGRIERR